jgi:outer membrane protein assembly factor BamB
MTRRLVSGLVVVLAAVSAGCTSGSSGPSCSYSNPTTLTASAWPKFHHDVQNTGHIDGVTVAPAGEALWIYPPLTEVRKGAFASSPVLNGNGTEDAPTTRVYIGSTDGQFYALNVSDGSADATFVVQTALPITSTGLVGVRKGEEAVFIGIGLGQVYGVNSTAENLDDGFPSNLVGYVASSVNLSPVDGTFYTGSLVGEITGLCPNGFARFLFATLPVQSSPAVGPDGTMYIGADDQQLRAFNPIGPILWSFSASAPIFSSPVAEVVDGTTIALYVADRGGFVFKVDANGIPVPGFDFATQNGGPVGPIASSPALANGRLYVGSDDGRLYAINAASGKIIWSFGTGGPIVSSPAVATGTDGPVVVVGSNDGNVYALRDEGATASAIMTFAVGAPVRSSPAIGDDGTIYVGADDGRVYAIQ